MLGTLGMGGWMGWGVITYYHHHQQQLQGLIQPFDNIHQMSAHTSTRLVLFKMLNTGALFREVQGVVKTGKESFIYFAPAAPAPSTTTSTTTAAASSTFVVGAGGSGAAAGVSAASAAVVDLTNEEEEDEEANSYVDDSEDEEGGSEVCGGPSASSLPPPQSTTAAAAAPSLPEWDRSRGCAIKVFKTTLNEFSKRGEYVEGDPRYHASLKFNKQTGRRMFALWSEKEFRNLCRMHRAGAYRMAFNAFCVVDMKCAIGPSYASHHSTHAATTGIPCPVPLEQKEHVLVMSFLGTEDGWPSPQLREAKLSPKAWAKCYRRYDTHALGHIFRFLLLPAYLTGLDGGLCSQWINGPAPTPLSLHTPLHTTASATSSATCTTRPGSSTATSANTTCSTTTAAPTSSMWARACGQPTRARPSS